jgi:hypothetical protein
VYDSEARDAVFAAPSDVRMLCARDNSISYCLQPSDQAFPSLLPCDKEVDESVNTGML